MNDNISYNKSKFWTYKRLKPTNKNTKKMFHLVNGKIATDKTLINRLNDIYIPPAYKNIVVAKSATNKVQVIGVDKKGRKQYIYNPSYVAKRNDRKYEDILELGKKIINIENDNISAIRNIANKKIEEFKLPDDLIPVIIYMLRKYHFRIGNEKYTDENKSYGITTLQPQHIKFHTPTKFTIEFIGKKGILNRMSDNNESMSKILKMLINRAKGSNKYIFSYINSNDNKTLMIVTPDHIQNFFENKYNAYITPKMFRTWYGNFHMLEHLRELYKKGDICHRMCISEKKNIVKSCSDYVSSKLNNTPTISKQSYMDNKLLELVMRNPYRISSNIPDDKDSQHKFLYKMITKLR